MPKRYVVCEVVTNDWGKHILPTIYSFDDPLAAEFDMMDYQTEEPNNSYCVIDTQDNDKVICESNGI